MKNKGPFFIALGLIVAPILVYWVLSMGKQNFNSLPYYGEKVVMEGSKDTIYYKVPDFKLTSQFGETITQETIGPRIYVANFFFARCKDVCPKMNGKLASVYEKCQEIDAKLEAEGLKNEYKNVLFLSHTVDPENDSVSVLAMYAERVGVKNKNWLFLTGSKEDIFKAGQGYLLPVSIEDQTIDHSQDLLLIDREKHIRGIYDGLEDRDIKRLKEDIDVLIKEYEHAIK